MFLCQRCPFWAVASRGTGAMPTCGFGLSVKATPARMRYSAAVASYTAFEPTGVFIKISPPGFR